MNTAKSVAYGWVVLVVAAGGSYYYAKQDLKGRKMSPAVREARQQNPANITWEDRLKEFGLKDGQGGGSTQTGTTAAPSSVSRPASRNHAAQDTKMNSVPTGVDTSSSSATSTSER